MKNEKQQQQNKQRKSTQQDKNRIRTMREH